MQRTLRDGRTGRRTENAWGYRESRSRIASGRGRVAGWGWEDSRDRGLYDN